MSVEDFSKLGGAVEFLDGHIPDDCYLCGKPLTGISVYWHGTQGRGIALHPDCGERLGAALIRDSLNAKLILKGSPVTAGVSRTLWGDTDTS